MLVERLLQAQVLAQMAMTDQTLFLQPLHQQVVVAVRHITTPALPLPEGLADLAVVVVDQKAHNLMVLLAPEQPIREVTEVLALV